MKNPRFKQKAQETYLKYALRINIEHMASLLYVLHELYPKTFTKSNIQKYINDHADTVAALGCGGDKLLKEYKIRQLCESCDYISRELADDITSKMKAKAPREKLRFFLENGQLYADNILLMLLTPHYDFGFGEKRIMATVEAWTACTKTDCIEWLDTYADAQIEDSVVIDIDGEQTAYYCDTAGFVEMPEFFREKELVQEKAEIQALTFLGNKANFETVMSASYNESFGTVIEDGDTLFTNYGGEKSRQKLAVPVETAEDENGKKTVVAPIPINTFNNEGEKSPHFGRDC